MAAPSPAPHAPAAAGDAAAPADRLAAAAGRYCPPLALAFFVLGMSTAVADTDLWGHLRFGLDTLARGGPALTDPYAYTNAGFPWTNHEWLSEAAYALALLVGGASGLALFKTALATAGGLVLWRLARRAAPPLPATAVFLLATFCLLPSAAIRPQIFTYLFTIVIVALIDRALASGRACTLLLLAPPLLALWANMHAGFVAGLGLLALAALVEGTRRRPRLPRVALVLTVVLPALATLATPYGLRYWPAVASAVSMARPHITEWHPFGPRTIADFPVLAAFPVLLAVSAAALATTQRRRDPVALAVLVVTALLALRHQRHIAFFAIAAAWAVSGHLASALARLAPPPRWRLAGAAALAGALLAVVPLRLALAMVGPAGIEVPRAAFPVGAVEFLRTHRVRGNLLAPFKWGEYCLWHLWPAMRVAIDGRYETAYPPEVFADFVAFDAGAPGWRRLVDDYPTEAILVSAGAAVAPRLRADSDWVEVYRDPAALVFLRRIPRFASLIRRYGRRPLTRPLPAGPVLFP